MTISVGANKPASPSMTSQFAGKVDGFLKAKFYKMGHFVGTRPGTSIALCLFVCFLCMGGISQMKSESRSSKLWIPQDTQAQADQATYNGYFPPSMRINMLVLEAKAPGGALGKDFLREALELHRQIEALSTEKGAHNLTSLCVQQPGNGHPCFISSILGHWGYETANLDADSNHLATLNAAGMSIDGMKSALGNPTFTGSSVNTADAMMMTYFLKTGSDTSRDSNSGGYANPEAEMWEEDMLNLLGCDSPTCDSDGSCACSYASDHLKVYARAERSFGDAFGSVIRGDVGLINAAFMIMVIYLVLNLGGLCHKVNSRALMALGCALSIVVAGATGYGISMWLGFPYTPVHGILPFVILGIGVDDSFVIMNAFDHTDPELPVPKRIAEAISHAGVSIMVTSLTDFVAFAISVSSALPALSAFCMYAAFCILALFLLQIFFFAALATFDARRVAANRIDCCPCLCRSGCPCCPVLPKEEACKALEDGKKDPNQMCCCSEGAHKGGRIGSFMENVFAPQLVKTPVVTAVVLIFVGFFGLCCWQTSELKVQDTQRNFIPDNSYVAGALGKMDVYFGENGQSVSLVTLQGDYFASQSGLTSISTKVNQLDFVKTTTGENFRSWADAYKLAGPYAAKDADGLSTVATEYYTGLKAWLSAAGGRYRGDVVWVNEADPTQGIQASKFQVELVAMNRVVGGRLIIDASRSIEVMDDLREACGSWTDLPGGKVMPYTYNFLTWETFRIVKQEMFVSVGLCLVAVFLITLVLLAHPVTAGLVSLSVVMTIVDILGCMNMWGLAIDNVSVINVVIAVGLCVDYAAHIGHSFMLKAGSRPERVIATMGDVGAAVLCGAVSTFLGVMLLGLSKSYVFRALFQTFFLTVVLGLAHGMILLPALLAVVGPDAYQVSTEVVNVDVSDKAQGS